MKEIIPLVVHATHEAGVKIGGIGSVLNGLLSAPAYNEQVERSLLVGPMYGGDHTLMDRLTEPRNRLQIRYSSLHGVYDGVDETLRDALQGIEQKFRVALLYGTRSFGGYEHEVLLVDASNPAPELVNSFKFYVWQNYGIDTLRYEHDSEFNYHVSVALPLMEAVQALGAGEGLTQDERILVAHEWIGMPLVFAAQLNEPGRWRTVFYGHETAVARRIIEGHPGHDTRFYNALRMGLDWSLFVDNLFGAQDDWYKTAVVYQAIRCDRIIAVGDLMVDELRFLGDAFRRAEIDLVYNGIPDNSPTLYQKRQAKRKLQTYCRNLLGYEPDYVFTHVARMSLSKAFWRDLRVLEHLAPMLREEGKTAVLFVLATAPPSGRPSGWVRAWEGQYGWPVGHRADNGDLVDQEIPFFFQGAEPFNWRHPNANVVLVNQFGWSQDRCGVRMPEEMEFRDIRWGSDLEFGQSIYEPFGIAQLEPLAAGALCCLSSVCGSTGFIRRAGADGIPPNIVVADYAAVPPEHRLRTPNDALQIGRSTREWIESMSSATAAQAIYDWLPRSEKQTERLLEQGRALAGKMGWNTVVEDYFLPSLRRTRA